MMEAARTSETSVDIQLKTRHYIPEDSKLHTRCRENLKSHIDMAANGQQKVGTDVVRVGNNSFAHGDCHGCNSLILLNMCTHVVLKVIC
jgi:hypothetical protein